MASDSSRGKSLSTLPKELPLEFLKKITDDFSEDRKLGESDFGTYYKGILENGDFLAVKKLAENAPLPPGKTFFNEVTNLMEIQHKNILKLVGFCRQQQTKLIQRNEKFMVVDVMECLLCYEYVPKESLDRCLFVQTSKIDWDTRYKIIDGICKGLHFLHKELDNPLIHMNLVPKSIWLDNNWAPKIADFGLSRLFGKEQTRVYTANLVGPNGYMAPEYLYKGEITTSLDIYSLGMLILEITTGERNGANSKDLSARKFVDKVRHDWMKDANIICMYPSLTGFGLEQVKACILIGLKCLEAEPDKRPSIVDIIEKLSGKNVPIFQKQK
ncbi:unnamed protein product [Urochloa humidicola]